PLTSSSPSFEDDLPPPFGALPIFNETQKKEEEDREENGSCKSSAITIVDAIPPVAATVFPEPIIVPSRSSSTHTGCRVCLNSEDRDCVCERMLPLRPPPPVLV